MKRVILFMFNKVFGTQISLTDLEGIAELIRVISKVLTQALPAIIEFVKLLIDSFDGDEVEASRFLNQSNAQMRVMNSSERAQVMRSFQRVMQRD